MRENVCNLERNVKEETKNSVFSLTKKFFDKLGNKTVLRKVSHVRQVNGLNIQTARAMLNDEKISDERLNKKLEQVKAFCKIAYQLYAKGSGTNDEKKIAREFLSEPPQQFTNAA